MNRSRRTFWHRTRLLGGVAIEIAVLAIACVVAGVLRLLDWRR
jgi:hypothetical protein